MQFLFAVSALLATVLSQQITPGDYRFKSTKCTSAGLPTCLLAIREGSQPNILVVGFATGMVAYYVGGQSGIDAFSTALVCAVAMIPEGLEALVTVVRSVLRETHSFKLCFCFVLTRFILFSCSF